MKGFRKEQQKKKKSGYVDLHPKSTDQTFSKMGLRSMSESNRSMNSTECVTGAVARFYLALKKKNRDTNLADMSFHLLLN